MHTDWISRTLEERIQRQLGRGKSILLLGPRQTGKTSLLERLPWDLEISFLVQKTRFEFERNPDSLIEEIGALDIQRPKVLIDEVQKVPEIMDVVQHLIDKRRATFALTGSSARRLRTGKAVNLLPGRVVSLRLDPLSLAEHKSPRLEDLLLYGSLPGVISEPDKRNQELDLDSYVTTFLEEEIRKEALVRSVPAFSRFIELAALDSGRICNLSEIGKQIGVSHTTIAAHYQILEDCLLVERFEPITRSSSRKKLTKSPRYIMFDLGVRRLAASEGTRLSPERMGELFEQFVGLELRRLLRGLGKVGADVSFWRDPDGPEVDWVITSSPEWIPIEVKWTSSPSKSDARHIELFLNEHPRQASRGYIVCRVETSRQITPRVRAIPWHKIPSVVQSVE